VALRSESTDYAPSASVFASHAGERAVSAHSVVTNDQVITWTRAGARDDLIIDRIERCDAVFRLTAGDELNLRQQGVSEDVIYAMKEAARR